MGRRLPRRMWHTAAALVPLPLIALGYVAAAPGNPVAFQIELYLAGKGSEQALTHRAEVAPPRLPREVASLFRAGGKGPRADQYLAPYTETSAGKQFISASMATDPSITGSLWARSEVNGMDKSDRLKSTTSVVALSNTVGGSEASFLLASAASSFDLETFRPSPEEIAYHLSPEALSFRYQGESQAEFEARERHCLSLAIYFEARGEPLRGQIAVGQVILNRVRSPAFPSTICGVVYQGQMQPGCQFSFTCDGKTDIPRQDAQWAQSQNIAKKIMAGQLWLPEIGYSTYYHANYVMPDWASSMSRIDTIGRHIFYKKRNEEPYVVEASAATPASVQAPATSNSLFSLAPTISLASTAGGGQATTSTPVMSLGYPASE
jgi:spore germination cell wall hydrolase CwlJ-like protein